ncbi:MAG TPA: hypothetical protein VGP68_03735 [Gemmataceae bacterium]|nr:hypothetical protein [Gemmataceae bacterium]
MRRQQARARLILLSYWRQASGALGSARKALRRIRRRLLKPRKPASALPVALPARAADRPLKRLGRTVRRLPRTTFRWSWSCLLLARRTARRGWRGFRAWLRFGHGYTFVRGFPALLACALVVWALLMPGFNKAGPIGQYAERFDAAVQRNDIVEAELCAERLVRDSKGNSLYLFAYAIILADKGEGSRALAIMNKLAPADAPGYGPAQLWTANRLLARKDPSPETLKEVEKRLIWASRDESSAPAAHALMIRYYVGMGKLDKAEDQIGSSGGSAPGAHLDVALAFAVRGNKEKAQKHAAEAREYYRNATKNQPENAEARLEWAKSAALLGDFPGAVAILEEGYQLTHAQGYRTTLSRLYFGWSTYLIGDRSRFVDRMELLAKSVEYDDSNPMVLRAFLDIPPLDRPDAKDLRAAIDQSIAKKISPAILQIFLGVDSLMNKDAEEAKRRFDLAQVADPASPRILNNMAWTLANTKPNRLTLALELVGIAVAQAPDQIRFLDTRGQVLAKLERWQEAMPDLQRAVEVLPENKDLQDAMARVSTHLQQKANEPKSQLPPGNPLRE